MSVGLIRVLYKHQIIDAEKAEKLRQELEQKRPVISALLQSGTINADKLASFLSGIFSIPYLNLELYSQNLVPLDLINLKIMQQHMCVPIFKRGNRLFLAVSDPTSIQHYQKIATDAGCILNLVIVRDDQLRQLLENLDHESSNLLDGMDSIGDTEATGSNAMSADEEDGENGPIAKFVFKILGDALAGGASDIHFEFYEEMARVRFRIDGQLREVVRMPLNIRSQVASRIKVMSKMDISEKRIPQDGRIQVQFRKGAKPIDFRVSTLPTLFGEKIVMRILNSDAATLNIEQLGFEPFQKELLLEAIHRPYGMVLVTGPTGSGKTVSLYTCLNILNTDSVNISTAEDPAEINLPGINQVNVNDKQGLTFAAALKSFLRQDPDIIMVGEIRDLETADIAIKAAQTGHMVFSTLHTNNAPATLSRMLNMGVAPFNIASSVNLIMAQRLVRRLCSCKAPAERPPEYALKKAGFSDEDLAKDWTFYRPVGCERCKGKGYKGRAGVYEVMPVSEEMQRIIMNNGNEVDISTQALKEGLVDLRHAGLLKVMEGITSLDEILATTND
ncbi:type IV-A pilus assembly ATPase PilB [Snodgrassella communis]|jgi:type IV pilus assembly protein PilB|uniref:Type IV-A pilus assembly ATPase PilB n=2 Tax=Snodgrassella TaxID=1193515 RepID=A0A066TJF7_9NEIS|nr:MULTISPECIES: type IV-A pilus assembly ATPase PilB [Snodgrassella]KDN12249.1 Type IV fimbrial assembly, ATPase PilB [Snodgrassella communis]KDN15010.1 Type IV fimbrial assembly, ATPase PilB [Snodgrassella communis]PIT08582.1 type IV-A pilus assembly ATPase PilB [Snodgrassella communis]PIT08942.1 type IV-A pilus assembly ATPase PilB [Snodgrassella communis]PIT22716.1 type IV-A pilus assembly ATPase PilB [Snodgrassella communis]